MSHLWTLKFCKTVRTKMWMNSSDTRVEQAGVDDDNSRSNHYLHGVGNEESNLRSARRKTYQWSHQPQRQKCGWSIAMESEDMCAREADLGEILGQRIALLQARAQTVGQIFGVWKALILVDLGVRQALFHQNDVIFSKTPSQKNLGVVMGQLCERDVQNFLNFQVNDERAGVTIVRFPSFCLPSPQSRINQGMSTSTIRVLFSFTSHSSPNMLSDTTQHIRPLPLAVTFLALHRSTRHTGGLSPPPGCLF